MADKMSDQVLFNDYLQDMGPLSAEEVEMLARMNQRYSDPSTGLSHRWSKGAAFPDKLTFHGEYIAPEEDTMRRAPFTVSPAPAVPAIEAAAANIRAEPQPDPVVEPPPPTTQPTEGFSLVDPSTLPGPEDPGITSGLGTGFPPKQDYGTEPKPPPEYNPSKKKPPFGSGFMESLGDLPWGGIGAAMALLAPALIGRLSGQKYGSEIGMKALADGVKKYGEEDGQLVKDKETGEWKMSQYEKPTTGAGGGYTVSGAIDTRTGKDVFIKKDKQGNIAGVDSPFAPRPQIIVGPSGPERVSNYLGYGPSGSGTGTTTTTGTGTVPTKPGVKKNRGFYQVKPTPTPTPQPAPTVAPSGDYITDENYGYTPDPNDQDVTPRPTGEFGPQPSATPQPEPLSHPAYKVLPNDHKQGYVKDIQELRKKIIPDGDPRLSFNPLPSENGNTFVARNRALLNRNINERNREEIKDINDRLFKISQKEQDQYVKLMQEFREERRKEKERKLKLDEKYRQERLKREEADLAYLRDSYTAWKNFLSERWGMKRGTQKVLGNLWERNMLARNARRIIRQIRRGWQLKAELGYIPADSDAVKATEQVAHELAMTMCRLLTGGVATVTGVDQLLTKHALGSYAAMVQFFTGSPQDFLNEEFLTQFDHQLATEEKFFKEQIEARVADQLIGIYPNLRHIAEHDPEYYKIIIDRLMMGTQFGDPNAADFKWIPNIKIVDDGQGNEKLYRMRTEKEIASIKASEKNPSIQLIKKYDEVPHAAQILWKNMKQGTTQSVAPNRGPIPTPEPQWQIVDTPDLPEIKAYYDPDKDILYRYDSKKNEFIETSNDELLEIYKKAKAKGKPGQGKK